MTDLVLERLRDALRDRYTPLRAIGQGGMATVYLARDLETDHDVAIKALRSHLAESVASQRFEREIGYLEQLHHPNIAPLLGSGDALGIPYFVTAYIDGKTLRQRLDAAPRKRLAVSETLRIAREIAGALDYAHAKNILHRDIKPENILFHHDVAVLADFGIARAIELAGEAALTDSGVAVGTPAYMAPEQLAADRRLDGTADVYALSCVVYEMLCGRPPFFGPRGVVDNGLKFTSTPDPLQFWAVDVNSEFDKHLRRGLAADPARRFTRAGELIAALEREVQLP